MSSGIIVQPEGRKVGGEDSASQRRQCSNLLRNATGLGKIALHRGGGARISSGMPSASRTIAAIARYAVWNNNTTGGEGKIAVLHRGGGAWISFGMPLALHTTDATVGFAIQNDSAVGGEKFM
uniref:Uncharacterized protein n=1 Tax=Musa acuminata TaxID=4641 RepID=Q1ENW8_MUSAC|nr:hypothetical protein MA4_111B14.52 [Musa acuminata]